MFSSTSMRVPFGARLFCVEVWERSYNLKDVEQNLWTLSTRCGQVHSCPQLRPSSQRSGSGASWAGGIVRSKAWAERILEVTRWGALSQNWDTQSVTISTWAHLVCSDCKSGPGTSRVGPRQLRLRLESEGAALQSLRR